MSISSTGDITQTSTTRALKTLSGGLSNTGTNGALLALTDGTNSHGIGHGNALFGDASPDLYINAGNSKNISLATANTIRMTVASTGYVKIDANGDVGVSVIAAKKLNLLTSDIIRASITSAGVFDLIYGQLKFPSTRNASADANTLDEYKEGTFTPSVTTSSGTITTFGSLTGVFTKIGNFVLVHLEINITTNGTGAGDIIVSNMPFTAKAGAFGQMPRRVLKHHLQALSFSERRELSCLCPIPSGKHLLPDYIGGLCKRVDF